MGPLPADNKTVASRPRSRHLSRSKPRKPDHRSGGLEPLEGRIYWSVTQDANGWTVVTPSANSQVIYVSSSVGSDSNSGLSASAPVASLAQAQSMVRSGYPDEILLKSGDTWNNQAFPNWTASGEDANDPMLISYYGSGARPVVNPGNLTNAFNTVSNASNPVNFLDVIGINFYAANRDPASATFNASQPGALTGFQDWAGGGNTLLEDDSFSYFHNNIDIEALGGFQTNMTVRRCVSSYSWSATSHSQGLYSNETDHLSILQCVFDHNGWNTLIPGATEQGYNHDIYYSYATTNVTVQGCILAEASFAGIMARSGGNIDNNVFIGDTIACSFGDADGANSTVGGVTGSLIGNVIIGDKSLAGLAYGQGFEIGNTKPGAGLLVSDNIFTQDTQHAKPAILLTYASGTKTPGGAVGENDVTISNNIMNGWWEGLQTDGAFVPGGTGLLAENDLKFIDNDVINATAREVRHDGVVDPSEETFAGNRYYDTALPTSQWMSVLSNTISIGQWIAGYEPSATVLTSIPYADPNRSVATYDGTLGNAGTIADFITHADSLSITSYQPQYLAQALIDYVRAGFQPDTTAPTGAAAVANVGAAAIGSSVYTFTVTYTDNFFLNTSSLGAGNILVTGPNGYVSPATFVSAGTSTTGVGGYQTTVATYTVPAPSGAWAMGDDGTYSVSLLPNQVKDTSGNAATAGVIGTFDADFTPPTAVATVTPITSAAAVASGYTFTVTYSDASGVDPTSLNSSELKATGPNGYFEYATLDSTAAGPTTSTGSTIVATYTLYGPGGTWVNAATGTYAIAAAGGQIADLFGNTLSAQTLASFAVSVGGAGSTTAPTGSITGTVFNDANGNGVMDARELPMVGVTVFIDLAGTGVYVAGDPTSITNATGTYSFAGLAAGQYTVLEQDPAGYTSTARSVAVAANQAVAGINIADVLGSSVVSGGTGGTGGSTTVPISTLLPVTTIPVAGRPAPAAPIKSANASSGTVTLGKAAANSLPVVAKLQTAAVATAVQSVVSAAL
jgi:hypothetical protein